jgi:hypothetical protein
LTSAQDDRLSWRLLARNGTLAGIIVFDIRCSTGSFASLLTADSGRCALTAIAITVSALLGSSLISTIWRLAQASRET